MEKRDIIDKEKIRELEQEQKKLAKVLEIKDTIKPSEIQFIAGADSVVIGNKIISAIVTIEDREIIEKKYVSEHVNFPYISGFRAYRELSSLLACFNLLEQKPDIVFIKAHGITHPRLGLASHLSIATKTPVIGIADSLIAGEEKDSDIVLRNKKVGKLISRKKGSRPLYVSPGNLISIKTAAILTEKNIFPPHRLPEPLYKAKRYIKEIMKELVSSSKEKIK